MADAPDSPLPGGTLLTPDQARELAARFAIMNPMAPRLLTVKEAELHLNLVERLLESPDPADHAYGMALARVYEGLMAVSGECFKRESSLRMAEAMLARASSHPFVEKREQCEQLARFADKVLLHCPPDAVDGYLREAGIAWEDIRAAAAELAAKP